MWLLSTVHQLAGISGSELPEDTALIKAILNVLPKPIAEGLKPTGWG